MQPASSEAAVVRNYLEVILDTPWNKASKVSINLNKAQEILDADHYGLDEVKQRIVEYLAVQSRVKSCVDQSSVWLAPGVGKTSLGESIAKATGREFVRMALGGVRDEAEIRGHRRTYIGAMPGKIVQSLTKVGVKNPLFCLMKLTRWHRIIEVTLLLHYLKCLTRRRTTSSMTITLIWILTCLKSCLSVLQTVWIFRAHYLTVWKSSVCRAIPKTKK